MNENDDNDDNSNKSVARRPDEGTRIVQKAKPSFMESETVIRTPVSQPSHATESPYEDDEKTVGHHTSVSYRPELGNQSNSTFGNEASSRLPPSKGRGVEKISNWNWQMPRIKIKKLSQNQWVFLIGVLFVGYLIYHEFNRKPSPPSKISRTDAPSTKDQFLSDMMRSMEKTKAN